MDKQRRGRQTPTTSLVLEYESSRGQEAVDLYNQTGRTAQEWQTQMMYDIMAVNSDSLWTHTKFGYSVPRRNGKTEKSRKHLKHQAFPGLFLVAAGEGFELCKVEEML